MTDIISCVILLYLFLRGWVKGFLLSLLAPLSLLVGAILAFTFYQQNKTGLALAVLFLGPFVLRFVMNKFLGLWKDENNKEKKLSLASRLSGSAISLSWSGAYLILFLVLLVSIPLKFSLIKNIQNDITTSKTYTFIQKYFGNFLSPSSLNFKKTFQALKNPNSFNHIQKTDEFKNLLQDNKIKAFLNDPDIQQLLDRKNIAEVLTHAKTRALFKDKNVLKKFMDLNKKIGETEMPAGESSEE